MVNISIKFIEVFVQNARHVSELPRTHRGDTYLFHHWFSTVLPGMGGDKPGSFQVTFVPHHSGNVSMNRTHF